MLGDLLLLGLGVGIGAGLMFLLIARAAEREIRRARGAMEAQAKLAEQWRAEARELQTRPPGWFPRDPRDPADWWKQGGGRP